MEFGSKFVYVKKAPTPANTAQETQSSAQPEPTTYVQSVAAKTTTIPNPPKEIYIYVRSIRNNVLRKKVVMIVSQLNHKRLTKQQLTRWTRTCWP